MNPSSVNPSKNPSRKLRVGVLRGGPHKEYEASLKSGKSVIDSLRGKEQYSIQDIFIDRSGTWHIGGLPRTPDRVLPHVDVVVNALHGRYGEDGHVQKILESHNVPFTGSASLGTAVGLNKTLTRRQFKQLGILVPEHVVVRKEEFVSDPQVVAQKIASRYPHLRIVRSIAPDIHHLHYHSTVKPVQSQDHLEVLLDQTFEESGADSVLVEEFVKGNNIVCGVIEGNASIDKNFAHEIYPLLPAGVDEQHSFIHPHSIGLSKEEISNIQNLAIQAHKALGLRHYSSTHFVLNRMGPYVVEVNILPSLAEDSVFPKSLAATGVSLGEFLEHIIARATNR